MKGLFLPALSVRHYWAYLIKLIVIFPVIYLIFCAGLYGQSELILELKNNVDDSDQSELPKLYMDLFVEYSSIDSDSALKYARLAQKAAKNVNNNLQFVRAKYALGWTFKELSMYDSAIKNYTEGERIAKNYLSDPDMNERYKALLNGLGLAYTYKGNYDSALFYHYESLNRRKELVVISNESRLDSSSYYLELAVAENNLGLVYYKIKDFETAIEFYNQAITHKISAGNREVRGNLVNLGLSYVGASTSSIDQNFQKAVNVFNQVINECSNDSIKCSDNILFESYNSLGVLYLNTDSIEKARSYLEIALDYSEKEDDLGKRLYALHNIASVYKESGNYGDAIEILNRGQKFTDSLNLQPLQAANFKMLASVHRNAGNNRLAYDYLTKYDSLNSIIFNEELINGIKNILVAQNQKTNDETISMKQEEIEYFKQSQLYLTVIIILAFLILFIVIYNNRQRQKVNKKLSHANEIIEQKNSQLQNVNISLEEKVRDRTMELKLANAALKKSNLELDNFIYKTSHDIRGPLATLQGICNVALLDVKDNKAIDYLEKLNGTATKLNEILSKLLIINQINNSDISKNPIIFNELAQQIILENANLSEDKHIETRLLIEPNLKFRCDEDLLRIIIGNLVNNAFKFYKKSYSVNSFVEIKARKNNLNIILEVTDNGIGIDEDADYKIFEIFSKATEMSDSAGLGLYLVKLSVEKLNGEIKLKRTNEGYTKFEVVLPLIK